jgi:ribosomal protein S18 acetylase RimI-like enzyme
VTTATTRLPEGWTTRRPTLDDIPAIHALVQASDIAAVGEPDFTADEVRERLTAPHTDLSRDTWLALDTEGQVVGWAYAVNDSAADRDFAEVYFWPGRGLPALRPLLAMLMERVAERATEFGHDPYTVRGGAIPTERDLIEALTDAGFVFVKQNARMQMSLAGTPTVAPEPPAGVTVREVRHDDDGEMRAFHAVIIEAFGDTDHGRPEYDDWRPSPGGDTSYSFDEWFVAEVDGRVVGVLESSDAGLADDEGWVKRLAVLRPFRKRGLGEALLRHAFAVYARKGRHVAGLGVDLDNPTAAIRLYEAVGMTALYRANIYETTVAPRKA